MPLTSKLAEMFPGVAQATFPARQLVRLMRRLPTVLRGFLYSHHWQAPADGWCLYDPHDPTAFELTNPLKVYVDSHKQGRGIWKWTHYFDIYHRHFQRFVGQEAHVLEIGIFSGGSLEMWREYFGPSCRVYGVDIEEACRVYEDERTRVFVGDQGDRAFWRRFKVAVPAVDIVIDDGGHLPEQQITTLEELLPHLRPGGVYLCEDVHGVMNGFAAYLSGLADNLNWSVLQYEKGRISSRLHPFQEAIGSIHLYPFAVVIEKARTRGQHFTAPRYGSEWQPFL